MITERHSPIKKYFCTGYGLRLQAIESGIAEKVMLHFANNGKCALCIHDSFVTSVDDESALFEIMKNEFNYRFGFIPRLKVAK